MRIIGNLTTKAVLFLTLTLGYSSAYAVVVSTKNAWARPTREGAKMTGVFLDITNPGKSDDSLVSATCECAEVTEIHESMHNHGMVKMQRIAALDIKAGETVTLKPGSFHIMLMGLKKPLKVGETVKLQLTFKQAGVVTVDAKVKTQ